MMTTPNEHKLARYPTTDQEEIPDILAPITGHVPIRTSNAPWRSLLSGNATDANDRVRAQLSTIHSTLLIGGIAVVLMRAQLPPASDAELLIDVMDVNFHCAFGYPKLTGNSFVSQAAAEKLHHLLFTLA
jgi:hypothetical protein